MTPAFLLALPLNLIVSAAKVERLDWELVAAIVSVESNGNPVAMRYEANYRHTLAVHQWANSLMITPETEELLQKSSQGLMQVMGALFREMGYRGYLPVLDAAENLKYGCKHLRSLFDRGYTEEQVVAAYNAGTPRRRGGMYVNQRYVDRVYVKLRELRQ